ncbi:MAG: hypothetical protein QNJ11_04570 [Woeseiaceae bacterium]|nr:hypothetical protein [Woeseiaceae bacterium]
MRADITLIVVLLFGSTQAHSAELADNLAGCRAIANDAERLACYDGLADTSSQAPPVAPSAETVVAPAPNTEADATPPPVPEDLGAEVLPEKPGEEKEPERFSATVTRCGEAADGRYLFYFKNGQIWRQAKDDRLYFRDCQFGVTITKDFFGYKMQQVGEKKRIRIRRVR